MPHLATAQEGEAPHLTPTRFISAIWVTPWVRHVAEGPRLWREEEGARGGQDSPRLIVK